MFKKITILFFILLNLNLSGQNNTEHSKIDSEYALKLLIKLDALMYSDSNIVYAFDTNDLKRNVSDLLSLDNEGNIVIDNKQLDPLITMALLELVKRNRDLEYKINTLEVENSNLNIYINNELSAIKHQIGIIQSEIAP